MGLFGQTRYSTKIWVFKSNFSSKVTQHGQQQLWLHPKYAKFSTKRWVLVHYYNPTCAYNQCYNLQQKSVLLLQSIFTLHPYLFTKSSLQSPLTFSSSILQQFFTSFFLRTNIPTMYTKNIFPTSTILPVQTGSRDQWVWRSFEDWHCFNLSFLQDMDSENRPHNHWFFITQSLKILYCRCIAGVANHPIHLPSNPQTIFITSIA